jgi:uncharacterized protein (TIGR02145 family)
MLRSLLSVVLFSLIGITASAQYASDWNPDADGDNTIGVNDLLALLSVFEETDSDNDGIFDSQDDCVGAYDACGVCNGPGPTVVVGDSLVCPIYGCTDNLASNFSASANTDDGTCTYGPAQCGGQSTITFDGHTYNLVAIGDQCWFKENLRSDKYRNGDAIPGNLTDSQWTSTGSGAQAVYSNDPSNFEMYGRLYNWYAVDDARGLCPSGFQVPSDGDWLELEMELGMTLEQANEIGQRGTNQGAQLKASPANSPSWNGTNSSGFGGLPGGRRNYNDGAYSFLGVAGLWWRSASQEHGWFRGLNSGDQVVRDHDHLQYGFSVRCVRDEGVACYDPDNDGVCAENEVSGCTDSNATNFSPSATEDDGSCVMPGPAQCGGASSVTFDGHTYSLVGIGNQCWFKENLRSDNYRNGDEIPGNLSNTEWTTTTSGAQSVMNEDPAYLSSFGRLYNWFAVNDVRGVCPTGFHVPSDVEWKNLEIALGMSSTQANFTGWRGTNQGSQMKSSPSDTPAWNGTNSGGLSIVPGGDFEFEWSNQGDYGRYWTSSTFGEATSVSRHFYSSYTTIFRGWNGWQTGFSVRCLKD